ncbi:sensor histidine kinase [Sellimonas sp.]|uniref:sensor histidine kinase n=1 Tax=Sellimonas sp. TaxID=2021466 RepID=UPI001302A120|nr:GHKL domain-containing protein [Sellimonas sp.]
MDILILACVLVAEHLVDRQTGKDHIPNLALLLVPLISIVILYLLVVNDTDLDYKVMIECIGLLAINFLVFYLYNALKNSLHHKYESDMLRQKMQGYSTQMETLLQNDEKIRIFRHDMRHHIMELQILAKQNDTDALLSYLDQMNQALTIQRESVSSGNPEIDSLLNYWLYKAKQTLQTVDVQVRLPEEILHTFDINSVVANLLQNAIEASSQSAEKYLSFSLSLSKGVLKLRIRNSFSEEAKSSRSRFFSSKKQDTLHGFGLRSVRHIVEKYDGVLELNKQGNMFEANAILYLPDEADD